VGRGTGGEDVVHEGDHPSGHEAASADGKGIANVAPSGGGRETGLGRRVLAADQGPLATRASRTAPQLGGEERGLVEATLPEPAWVKGNGYDDVAFSKEISNGPVLEEHARQPPGHLPTPAVLQLVDGHAKAAFIGSETHTG
jgi:hypothetical protein